LTWQTSISDTSAAVIGVALLVVLAAWMWHWSARHEAVIRRKWNNVLLSPRIAALRERFSPQLKSLRARLSPHGYFVLQLTAGMSALIGASWLFGEISEGILTGDPLTVVDQAIAELFRRHATTPVTSLMFVISNLHGVVAITTYMALLALALLRKRDWYWLWCVALTVPGGMLLNELMKHAFQRSRPTLNDPLLTLSTYSFPSGHVAGAALFYGVLGALLIAKIPVWRWRVLIAFVAITLVVLVALSRLYLGVHYLSDVLAAFAEAVAWLSLCLMAVQTFWQRRGGASKKEITNVSRYP
jgi:undecaprenyl-diphosphatase